LFRRILYLLLTLIVISSCELGDEENKTKLKDQETSANEALEKANKYLIRTEKEDIENYIRRHQLEMEETGSGLRYMFFEKGNGIKAETGKTVVLKYNLKLLTGDLIYSSEEDGPKIFKIGKGNVESGLEEALHYLRVGDKVKLILPAHLAYGLLGDNNKIPPRSTLVYNIEVVEIK
jgi:FKBP-type peptidyl-prolyl cis-trans isomerase